MVPFIWSQLLLYYQGDKIRLCHSYLEGLIIVFAELVGSANVIIIISEAGGERLV